KGYNESMLSRLAVVVAFVVAYLAQPLALDACSVSCEAARAARAPAVAAPCHHTTSCASQIVQAPSPGSTPVAHAIVPAAVSIAVPRPAPLVVVWLPHDALASSSPPISTQLRL